MRPPVTCFVVRAAAAGLLAWCLAAAPAGAQTPYLVKDIRPGADSSFSGITNTNGSSAVIGSTLFFAANDGVHGIELWKSDGTAEGTAMVKDVLPEGSAYPFGFVVVGGVLYFAAADDTGGHDLWRSDGTEAGTTLVADVNATYLYPQAANVGGALFFATPWALWKSDGTPGGTTALADVYGAEYLVGANGRLFFAAERSPFGKELWTSDGTAAGTVMVKDIRPGDSSPRYITALGSTVLFAAVDGSHGEELWRSDGTAAGTWLVMDISPGSWGSYPRLWWTVGNSVLFEATDGTHGWELFRTDGTAAGTWLVKDIWPGLEGSRPENGVVVGPQLLFCADDGTHGWEPFITDGTAAGTRFLLDIYPGPDSGCFSLHGRATESPVYAYALDGVHGVELWRTDGTPEGTSMVVDLRPGSGSSLELGNRIWPVRAGDRLFFVGNDGVAGHELWALDVGVPPADFYTLTPCRLFDTRQPGSIAGGALAPFEVRTVDVAGPCPIPADAQALSLNVTVTGSAAAGNLVVFPGGFRPVASTVNYRAGATQANNAIVSLSGGRLSLRAAQASGTVHVIVDVNGYFR